MSNRSYEDIAERVQDDVEALVCRDNLACIDFVNWLAEEKGLLYFELLTAWLKTPDGKAWLEVEIQAQYESLRDADDLRGDR